MNHMKRSENHKPGFNSALNAFSILGYISKLIVIAYVYLSFWVSLSQPIQKIIEFTIVAVDEKL